MKLQLGQNDILFPVPAALIGSSYENTNDIITISWVGMVSSTPPTIGISLDKSRHSLDLIRRSKLFSVNIPSAQLYQEVDYCGLVSGKSTDKFHDTGLTPITETKTGVPIIKECPFNLECQVVSELELGDYILVLGEIVEIHVDQDKVEYHNNKPKINVGDIDPLVYCPTIREYWSIGQMLGNSFNAGKEILHKVRRQG